MIVLDWINRYKASFSFVGVIFAVFFFSWSLTPSLLPRTAVTQGVLSGLAINFGYALGVILAWLWNYLELPDIKDKALSLAKGASTIAAALTVIFFLWQFQTWQNSIRELMEMEPLTSVYPITLGLVTVLTSTLIIGLARLIRRIYGFIAKKINRTIPRRLSNVLSLVIVILLVVVVANKVFLSVALDAADSAFLNLDKLVDDGVEQPTDELATGSSQSLIDWDSIGRRGKNFIVGSPSIEQLKNFPGEDKQKPLRVYVGLRSAETLHERAALALEELKRVQAFERSLLVVATPTGTGWLDPGAVDTLEYLHGGNTAIVAIQYSYLPSWLTLMVNPNKSRNAAQILFDKIYSHWTRLPKESRPNLYLHGLSLGALGSEASLEMFKIFEDPIQGGVWSGPPFPSTMWASATRSRNPDSPVWLPRIGDGSLMRFTGRENALRNFGNEWGAMRIVYIQHASDPMTFFSPNILVRRPNWLIGERGPDVSPFLRWYPIVTFLQIGLDLPMATSVPFGFGHNISPTSYIDAWMEVTQPQGWSKNEISRLKEVFSK